MMFFQIFLNLATAKLFAIISIIKDYYFNIRYIKMYKLTFNI